MTRTPEEIEREVEAARGDLDRTVDALKDRMSPGQLIDELTRGLKGGAGGEMLNSLGAQTRDNPMALAMIGAGMAWLMMGRSPPHSAGAEPASFAPSEASTHQTSLGDAAEKVGDKISNVAEALKAGVTSQSEHATDGLQNLGGRAAAMGHDAARSFEGLLQKEPLIVGALGLAVGVALGAALPATNAEDRAFGAARDDLLRTGETKVHDVAQSLRASGAAAMEAAKAEADRQGLMGNPGDASVVEKAEAVVRSGFDAAKGQLGGDRQA